MVKNMCFLLKGSNPEGGRVCRLVPQTRRSHTQTRRSHSQIVWRSGVPCPTNKKVSYTNLMRWLGRYLKNRLLLLLILIGILKINIELLLIFLKDIKLSDI